MVDATELARRLRFMADAGDMGRESEPTDTRRLAAAALEGLESRLRVAVWNYCKAKGMRDSAAIAAVEVEVSRATAGKFARDSGSGAERENPERSGGVEAEGRQSGVSDSERIAQPLPQGPSS